MPSKSAPPPAEDERASRPRLALLSLALLASLGLFVHKFGHTLLYSFRHKDPTVVPFEGEPVLPVVKHVHAPGSARETHETLVVDGMPRRYVLLVPRAPKAGPLPLVLVFHGDGGSEIPPDAQLDQLPRRHLRLRLHQRHVACGRHGEVMRENRCAWDERVAVHGVDTDE